MVIGELSGSSAAGRSAGVASSAVRQGGSGRTGLGGRLARTRTAASPEMTIGCAPWAIERGDGRERDPSKVASFDSDFLDIA